MNIRKLFAEFLGTLLLVFFGCGIAVRFGSMYLNGVLTIALGFGLVLTAAIYMFGGISGCHINPAVSFAMLLSGRMSFIDFVGYVIAQFLGGIAGAGALACILGESSLGANSFGALSTSGISLHWYGAFIVEVILTFVFVLTVLFSTADKKFSGVAGIVNGVALTLVHIFGIPYTGTSVNPARSFGPALINALTHGGKGTSVDYLKQVWLFILAPLVGAAIAAGVYMLFTGVKTCCKKRCSCNEQESESSDEETIVD